MYSVFLTQIFRMKLKRIAFSGVFTLALHREIVSFMTLKHKSFCLDFSKNCITKTLWTWLVFIIAAKAFNCFQDNHIIRQVCVHT